MATMAEIEAGRVIRDEPMLVLVRAGRTAKQIAQEIGVASSTVRRRAAKYGMTCDVSKSRPGIVPTRSVVIQKPCHCSKGCRSVYSMGHRFGADTYCECGDSWYVHQRFPVACRTGKRVESVRVEYRKKPRTHCTKGHPWVDVYRSPSGKEQCRICRRQQHMEYTERRAGRAE